MATQNSLLPPINFICMACLLTGATAPSISNAEKLKQVYLDDKQNVHIVTARGHHIQVTNKKNSSEVKLAPDKETVAWLVLNNWTAEDDIRPGSEELVIYSSGKVKSIKCRPFIRDYWFWKNGNQVAIDCGGRHFAGREILYDSKTLKEVSRLDQNDVPLEKRPDWSNGDN